MKKVKVFIFVPSLKGGGAERVSHKIASRLNPQQFDATLVVGKKEGEYVSQLSPSLRVIDLQKERVRGCLLPLIFLFRKERPDVVISFMHHSNLIVLLAKALSFSGVKVITAERNVMEPAYEKVPRVILPAVRFLYRLSDASLAGSQGLKENVRDFLCVPEEKFRVIYNPLDFEFIEKKSKEEANHPWLKDKQFPVVLGIGRLVQQKDFTTLIRAFALAKKPEGTRLLILGQGPLRQDFLSLAEELGVFSFVDLPGFQENPYAFLARADVFVLSSLWEGFGNVLPEAMALGLPIVSTDCNYGPREIIEQGRNGLLVPPGDAEEMAKRIERMLNDREFALSCGKNAKLTAQRLAVGEITRQYEEFVLSVAEAS